MFVLEKVVIDGKAYHKSCCEQQAEISLSGNNLDNEAPSPNDDLIKGTENCADVESDRQSASSPLAMVCDKEIGPPKVLEEQNVEKSHTHDVQTCYATDDENGFEGSNSTAQDLKEVELASATLDDNSVTDEISPICPVDVETNKQEKELNSSDEQLSESLAKVSLNDSSHHYPVDMNPFGESDNDNEDSSVPCKSYPTDLNPFGEESGNEEDLPVKVPLIQKRRETYDDALNPFGESVETPNGTFTPVPKPRKSRESQNSSPLPFKKGDFLLSSLERRKKRPAPMPPKSPSNLSQNSSRRESINSNGNYY